MDSILLHIGNSRDEADSLIVKRTESDFRIILEP
jgi:hypothetical protein